ncbi:hypothetical protein [Stieleria bergensis]
MKRRCFRSTGRYWIARYWIARYWGIHHDSPTQRAKRSEQAGRRRYE